jgi:hypothetical protein
MQSNPTDDLKETTHLANARGHVRVYRVNEDGSEDLIDDRKNQITYLHLSQLAQLIVQRSTLNASELAIYKLQVESSVTPLPAPEPTDTGIVGTMAHEHIFNKDADTTINVGGVEGLVQFRAELSKGQANGTVISAVALFTEGDGLGGLPVLVARYLTTQVTKTADIGIRFEWDIQYTIVL